MRSREWIMLMVDPDIIPAEGEFRELQRWFWSADHSWMNWFLRSRTMKEGKTKFGGQNWGHCMTWKTNFTFVCDFRFNKSGSPCSWTSCKSQSKRMSFFQRTPKIPICQILHSENNYPFVISTTKNMVPKAARAASAVTFLHTLNGNKSPARRLQISGVFPPFLAHTIHLMNPSAGLGRLLRLCWKSKELTEIYIEKPFQGS